MAPATDPSASLRDAVLGVIDVQPRFMPGGDAVVAVINRLLATDFCVAWSAADARRLGYTVTVIEDACRAIALPAPGGGTTLDTARAELRAAGVRFLHSHEI